MLNIVRVLALPDPLVANTIYLVSKSATELQVVTVGNTAADVRSTIIGTDVDGKITAANTAQSTALTTLITDGDAATLAAAGVAATAYTDAEIAELAGIATAADTATLNAAKAYSDAGDATTLTAANTYADGVVSTAIAGLDLSNSAQLVADIAARDLLELTKNSFVLVSDASADVTVDVGAALYFYNVGDDSYTKVAEYESLDVVIPNKAILEQFSDVGDQLYYKGVAVGTVQAGTMEW